MLAMNKPRPDKESQIPFQRNSYPQFLITGARVHQNYTAALNDYLDTIRRCGKSSSVARRALRNAENLLRTKWNKEESFYRVHGRYQGPNPFTSANPVLTGNASER